jgi:hypothetical protein
MEIEETKEKIVKELKGKIMFEVIYKFSDVIEEIEAESKEEAEKIADERLKNSKDYGEIKDDTYCYGTEVEEQ